MSELPTVLLDADICRELRISLTTLKRLRRHGAFPITELPALDKRHRYSRSDVQAFLDRDGTQRLTLTRRRA